jgi:phosphatidylethanolamine/phosphatidyl-N-methylethanolamine N-methyltransferase
METFYALFKDFFSYIDFYDKTSWLSAFMIIICPVTWNLIARWEFHTKVFTKIAGDNRLAADIFAHILIEMGILRNYLFKRAIEGQMGYPFFEEYKIYAVFLGYSLVTFGTIIVLMAYYRLGIHGIYYGDYFGILMKEKVTAFPYNFLENPLYVGSSSIFLGLTIAYISPCGLLLTVLVLFMYKMASILENPMTDLIYCVDNIKAVEKMKKERDEKEMICEEMEERYETDGEN